jgi:hypothetical protein
MHAARSGQTDTSQNSEIDRLNERSLHAAQQGHAFDVGSAEGNAGGMNKGGMGSGGMNSGSGSGNMNGNGSGTMSGSGSSSGSSHM